MGDLSCPCLARSPDVRRHFLRTIAFEKMPIVLGCGYVGSIDSRKYSKFVLRCGGCLALFTGRGAMDRELAMDAIFLRRKLELICCLGASRQDDGDGRQQVMVDCA